MARGILFDLDGTLVSSSEDIRATLNETLSFFSLPTVSRDEVLRMIGYGARVLTDRAVRDRTDLRDAVFEDFSRRFAACDNSRSFAFPGAKDALSHFKEEGAKIAVVSNKPQYAVYDVMDAFFPNLVDLALGQGDFPTKPAPDAAIFAMASLGLEKSECVFVGDGETDIETAKNAGIACVSVLWGFRSREELENAGGKIFVSTFSELVTVLDDMKNK